MPSTVHTVPNIGGGESPEPTIRVHAMLLLSSSPVGVYLSRNGFTAQALSDPAASSSDPTVGPKFGWSM